MHKQSFQWSSDFLKFMCVVQCGHNKIIWIENYEFFVLFLKDNLSSLKFPFNMLLFDALAVTFDELF